MCVVIFMIAAAVLAYFTIRKRRYSLVAIQILLFAVNGALFYWQGAIRAAMN